MNKNRIAFITSSPSIVNSFLKNHIRELSKSYNVTILSNIEGKKEKSNLAYSSQKDAYKELSDYASIRHVNLTRRITLLNDIKTIFQLKRLFKTEKYKSIHSITSKVGIMVMIAAYLNKTQIRLHTYTGQVWANKRGINRYFFKLMDKTIAKLSTYTYADSISQMNFLINEKVVPKDKIKVLGAGSISGVDLKRFYPDQLSRNQLRKEYSIDNNAIVFLLLCRLTRDKGVIDLARAFAKIVKELNSYLLVVGPDEENLIPDIKEIVGEEFKSKISFHGYTHCHEKFLNAADILCLPSYREGFGSIIIDAAAVGIPSIGSDIYGISDAIQDNITGILHKVGDINSIYQSMYKLASNPNLMKQMGTEAKARVKEIFSMEKITQAWIDEYQTLVEEK